MKSTKVQLRVFATFAILLVGGCAPAYHAYSGCRVNCKYCPPCPLPYDHYPECVCHSCVASKYLTNKPPADLEPVPAEALENIEER